MDVPSHVGAGKATIQVKADKGKDTTTLTANLDVKETKTRPRPSRQVVRVGQVLEDGDDGHADLHAPPTPSPS